MCPCGQFGQWQRDIACTGWNTGTHHGFAVEPFDGEGVDGNVGVTHGAPKDHQVTDPSFCAIFWSQQHTVGWGVVGSNFNVDGVTFDLSIGICGRQSNGVQPLREVGCECGGAIAVRCSGEQFAIGVAGPGDADGVGSIFIIGDETFEFDGLVAIIKGPVARRHFGCCDGHIGCPGRVVWPHLNIEGVRREVSGRIGDGQGDGVDAFGKVG